jgi:hypothetical protein
MYQSYPTPDVPQGQPQPPRPVQTAVRLMYVGAALSAIGVIITFVTISSLKSAIEAQNPTLTQTQVDTARNIAIAAVVIGGLIGVGLWLWMAWANSKGKNWARITSAVFFAIYTVELLFTLTRAHATLTLVFSFIMWAVGLAAIVLLFNKESTPFFQQGSMQRY